MGRHGSVTEISVQEPRKGLAWLNSGNVGEVGGLNKAEEEVGFEFTDFEGMTGLRGDVSGCRVLG